MGKVAAFIFFPCICQRRWWTDWQDYLRSWVSSSQWLHVWSLLALYVAFYTQTRYHGITWITETSIHHQVWHLDFFCSGTPSSSWTLSTTLIFDSRPCFEILMLATSFLGFWLMQSISCCSPLTPLARISSLFFFFVLLKTIWVLLRSASVWLSKVCLLENMRSRWMFFKIANAFLLK